MTYSECKAIYKRWDSMARLGPIEPYLVRDSIRSQAENADLRRQLAEAQAERNTAWKDLVDITKRLNAATNGINAREEIHREQLERIRERHRLEIDEYKRTLSGIDDEVAEFNAGFEACKNGKPIEAEPSELQFDVWRHGWIVANHDHLCAENADLRRKLAGVERDRMEEDEEARSD